MRERLSLFVAALWWGGTATLAFVAVPLLFAHFGNPALAGPMAARLFTVVSALAVGCGLVLLLSRRNQPAIEAAMPAILLGMLCGLLQEFGAAPRILTARASGGHLALWHGVGSALVLAQWLCASAVLWRLSRPRSH